VISEQFRPEGFNMGFNESTAAGQTVFHFHLHIIPVTRAMSLTPGVEFDTSFLTKPIILRLTLAVLKLR
jgi:diadenosine tetraphosphate (Ap4A) HIT family hydrolase